MMTSKIFFPIILNVSSSSMKEGKKERSLFIGKKSQGVKMEPHIHTV